MGLVLIETSRALAHTHPSLFIKDYYDYCDDHDDGCVLILWSHSLGMFRTIKIANRVNVDNNQCRFYTLDPL